MNKIMCCMNKIISTVRVRILKNYKNYYLLFYINIKIKNL